MSPLPIYMLYLEVDGRFMLSLMMYDPLPVGIIYLEVDGRFMLSLMMYEFTPNLYIIS